MNVLAANKRKRKRRGGKKHKRPVAQKENESNEMLLHAVENDRETYSLVVSIQSLSILHGGNMDFKLQLKYNGFRNEQEQQVLLEKYKSWFSEYLWEILDFSLMSGSKVVYSTEENELLRGEGSLTSDRKQRMLDELQQIERS